MISPAFNALGQDLSQLAEGSGVPSSKNFNVGASIMSKIRICRQASRALHTKRSKEKDAKGF